MKKIIIASIFLMSLGIIEANAQVVVRRPVRKVVVAHKPVLVVPVRRVIVVPKPVVVAPVSAVVATPAPLLKVVNTTSVKVVKTPRRRVVVI